MGPQFVPSLNEGYSLDNFNIKGILGLKNTYDENGEEEEIDVLPEEHETRLEEPMLEIVLVLQLETDGVHRTCAEHHKSGEYHFRGPDRTRVSLIVTTTCHFWDISLFFDFPG